MSDLTTVTGCLNAGNFSQAESVAGVTMPGNQPIIDAIQACMDYQNSLSSAVKAALDIADGN